MIELTDEMFNAFYEAGVDRDFLLSDTRAGLAAVLAIVERDYRVEPRPPWEREPCACSHGRPIHAEDGCQFRERGWACSCTEWRSP